LIWEEIDWCFHIGKRAFLAFLPLKLKCGIKFPDLLKAEIEGLFGSITMEKFLLFLEKLFLLNKESIFIKKQL